MVLIKQFFRVVLANKHADYLQRGTSIYSRQNRIKQFFGVVQANKDADYLSAGHEYILAPELGNKDADYLSAGHEYILAPELGYPSGGG